MIRNLLPELLNGVGQITHGYVQRVERADLGERVVRPEGLPAQQILTVVGVHAIDRVPRVVAGTPRNVCVLTSLVLIGQTLIKNSTYQL